ncbi:MAG: hypothetical protein WBR26_21920 [Candidatus Acidiferrum sp.]
MSTRARSCLAIWRQLSDHPRPVLPAVAIVRKDQSIAVDVDHRDWIVIPIARIIGSSLRHHLMHERGTTGSDAQRPSTSPGGMLAALFSSLVSVSDLLCTDSEPL